MRIQTKKGCYGKKTAFYGKKTAFWWECGIAGPPEWNWGKAGVAGKWYQASRDTVNLPRQASGF